MTAIDLITRALRTITVLGEAETPTAGQSSDSLAVLNEMLDSWNISRLYVYQIVTNTFSAVVGQSVYTIGSGGDLSMARPTQITNLNYYVAPIDHEVTSTTDSAFANIAYKAAPGIPAVYNYTPSFPLGSLSLYPTPGVSGTLKIQSPQQLTQFASLTTDIALPPGYAAAVRLGLAVELCTEFGLEVSPSLHARANRAIKRLRRMNVEVPLLNAQSDATTSGNILSGFH
jgi:hypothetical protein